MNFPLTRRGGLWVLPPGFQDYQLMVVDGNYHMGYRAAQSYFEPPICGASTASKNVSRKAEVKIPDHVLEGFGRIGMEPGIDLCDDCYEELF